ncbi:MAG: hypothetical protein WBA23_19660 [Tunicatimonas sp.]
MSLNILAIPLTYLDFTLRQDYYANVLCQNQDQPIAVCGGQCFVDKQVMLLQTTTQPSSDAAPMAPTLEIDLSVYVASQLLHFTSNQYLSESSSYSNRSISSSTDHPVSVFHPPQG